jgi:hypothetical protein
LSLAVAAVVVWVAVAVRVALELQQVHQVVVLLPRLHCLLALLKPTLLWWVQGVQVLLLALLAPVQTALLLR